MLVVQVPVASSASAINVGTTDAGQGMDRAGMGPVRAGRNPVIMPNFSSMVTTVSKSALVHTSILYNHTSTTPTSQPLVSMYTHIRPQTRGTPAIWSITNMSRIDSAVLQLFKMTGQGPPQSTNKNANINVGSKIRVYATNYNVLRIMSGMGGLAYSN